MGRGKWGSSPRGSRVAAMTERRRVTMGQCVQPSAAARGRSLAQFAPGPDPKAELGHKDGRCQVDGARGRL
jgi:hypothetical protein